MGVNKVAPNLYHSTFSLEDGSKCIDLGCYMEKGPAAVAVDLMAFRFRWDPKEDRRLPPLDHLEHPLELYNKVSRQIIKELSVSMEELAVNLKCHLACQLFRTLDSQPSETLNPPSSSSELKHKTDVPEPHADRPSKKPKFSSTFLQKKDQAQQQGEVMEPTCDPLLSPEGDLPSFIPVPAPQQSQYASVLREYIDTNSEPVKDIFHMWIKATPEFPPGSGRYPVYVKEGPLKQGYLTLVHGVTRALLEEAHHGEITLQNVDDSRRSWKVMYFVKDTAHREVGNFKGERFLQGIQDLARDLKIKAGDVLYFMKGDGKTFMYCGLWESGSAEAREFTKALNESHTRC